MKWHLEFGGQCAAFDDDVPEHLGLEAYGRSNLYKVRMWETLS